MLDPLSTFSDPSLITFRAFEPSAIPANRFSIYLPASIDPIKLDLGMTFNIQASLVFAYDQRSASATFPSMIVSRSLSRHDPCMITVLVRYRQDKKGLRTQGLASLSSLT